MKFAPFIPLLPLAGFLINGLLRNRLSKTATGIVGSGVVLIAFVLSILVFNSAAAGQSQIFQLFEFIKVGSLNIPFEFQVDQLTALFLLVITGVGFLIHVYSTAYMHEESNAHFARYFAYLNLFVFSMLLLVMGGNYVIMFIGWEGVGLCSYLLIGYWFKNREYNNAAKKAFVMNRIGDLGFLIAVFWMIQTFGSTSYANIFTQLPGEASTAVLTGITLLLLVGAMGKSAQIPLYTWLPDAMAGPTPVSALIHAATMVTAGIYMIARSNLMYALAPASMHVVAIVGLATALLAATIAIKQNDIKKVLAYSTVSQLGYMFLGLGVGAFTGAVFHVMTHAFFKALLFLGAGSVIHAMHHQQDMRFYGGLKKFMPITHFTMLMGCLAIAGIPPFSGFFSKDEILVHAFEANPIYYILGLLGALMTAFYMFRLYAMTFMGEHRSDLSHHHPHESPKAMTIPLIVLAVLSVVGGIIGIPALFMHDGHKLNTFLTPVFEGSKQYLEKHEPLSHSQEWMMIAISVSLIVVMIVLAIRKYSKSVDAEATGLGKVLENKWYVDELYDTIIVKPLLAIGGFFNTVVEKSGIDRLVNGVGKGLHYSSRQLRLLQSGNVGSYLLMIVIAIILLIRLVFYVKL
ncbi:MAG: NADH-quinone oxidoreductase subunit L [Bacteroidetes bacterium]|uniref:NADH-quinone oxidoreductase subunit L n=1 Tax=Phnomibacter sp. TaxID=2836217 RepID=UPI002FDC82F2|nr:NADH-quinone oxidoreductase subunit L [Bacteroidota bacterium]